MKSHLRGMTWYLHDDEEGDGGHAGEDQAVHRQPLALLRHVVRDDQGCGGQTA